MKCWLDQSVHVLAAAIQLALKCPTRIINHRPFDEDRRATCWTPETARIARPKRKDLARPHPYAKPDEDGHCTVCGLPWPDKRDTEEKHICPPGFYGSLIDRAQESK